MANALMIDLREIVLGNQTFGPSDIERICLAICEDFTQLALLRDAVQELDASEDKSPATRTRLGVCLYLLGRFQDAEVALKQGDGGALTQFYLGKVCFQMQEHEKAVAYFEAASKAGYTPELCQLATAEVHRYAGDGQGAMKLLDNIFGPVEQTAEYLYQRGATVAAIGAVCLRPWPIISEPPRSIPSMLAHCSAWRSRMIGSETMMIRLSTTSGQPRSFRLTLEP